MIALTVVAAVPVASISGLEAAAAGTPARALAAIALRGAVLLAVAALAAGLMRGTSAAIRHLIWAAAVAGLLLLPAASLLVPAWEVIPSPLPAPSSAAAARSGPAGDPALAPAGVAPAERAPAERAPVDRAAMGRNPAVSAPADRLPAERAPAGPGRSWAPLLVALWAAGAAVVLALVAAEALRLRRLARRAEPVTTGSLAAAVRRLAGEAGLRSPPRLLLGEPSALPMTWGLRRPVVLLPRGAEDWPAVRLEAVLRHELAHVRRRDHAVQLAAAIGCALHWFDPLAWLAARRLRLERELACDDEVLAAGSRPSEYARQLVELARTLREPGPPSMTATAMARPSGLAERTRALLDASRPRRSVTAPRAAVAALACMALTAGLAGLAPAPVSAGAERAAARLDRDGVPASWSECWSEGVSRHMHVNEEHGRWDVEWSSDGCRATMRLRGEPHFDDTFRRIVGLEEGGELLLTERANGTDRRLDVSPGPGAPQFDWRIDGQRHPFDAEAEAWLAERLLVLLRMTGIAAEQRVESILAREGIDGVLREIRVLHADSVMARYARALDARAGLSGSQDAALLSAVAEGIGSDSTMAALLVDLAEHDPRRMGDGRAARAFEDAAHTIGSDSSFAGMALRLAELDRSAASLTRLLSWSADTIGSDSVMAGLIVRFAALHPQALSDDRVLPALEAAVETIGSDSSFRRMAVALIEDNGEAELLALVLDWAARSVGSDSAMAGLLTSIAAQHPEAVAGPVRAHFLRAADTIGSASARQRVSRALEDTTDIR